MSRQSIAPPRNLTLTEELEKLEQSITLTLQEIDHNFSRAHRIVTANILPIVEQYGKHSEAVWEGGKFWKQFFEASANVSLSGYVASEEGSTAHEEETQESQLYDDGVEDTVTGAMATPQRPTSSQSGDYDDTSTIDSPTTAHAHSTPRAPQSAPEEDSSFAEYPSPYESLKRELASKSQNYGPEPTTPGKTQTQFLPDMSMEPESSPFMPPTSTRKYTGNRNVVKDPVLHHMLDKTYRIQATPHTAQKLKVSEHTPGATRPGASALDNWSPDSSPGFSPAPVLRANIFRSPTKAPRTPRPGVSVQQTPRTGTKTFNATQTRGVFDSDSEESEMGFSPPKTMSFQIPQSRLLQTPAREASRRIVQDMLLTAGGDITDTGEFDEDDSPSVVRQRVDLDDSF